VKFSDKLLNFIYFTKFSFKGCMYMFIGPSWKLRPIIELLYSAAFFHLRELVIQHKVYHCRQQHSGSLVLAQIMKLHLDRLAGLGTDNETLLR
jgi:hypothetical protein